MMKSHTYIAIPPGATIKEQLVDRGMTQKEFALRMGMSEKHISKMINGEVQLTIEAARKLEMVLGVPTQYWCNLESIYREKIAKVMEENAMSEDIIIAQKMPVSDLVKYGWIEKTTKWTDRVTHLRKYFEVVQLQMLKESLIPQIACKKLSGMKEDDLAIIAWAQKAKVEARKIETKPINISAMEQSIPGLAQMIKKNGFEACSEAAKILAECGVALACLPCFEEFFIHGATFIDGNKIVVGLTLDEDINERFGFYLFHELAHVLNGDLEKTDGTTEADEVLADEFAERVLSNI